MVLNNDITPINMKNMDVSKIYAITMAGVVKILKY